ncbi:MAG: peptidoglycan-binding protein LysM, partial [Neisseria sp.]|nr:peptidoglycan-binding protein LysM [Neisseria sp.]
MLKQTALRTAPLALVLLLGACSWLQQPAAPVVAGTAGSATTGTPADQSNPYGATPYDPNAAGAAPAPYTPPVSSGGTYTPSYAPVDINAA